MKPLVIIGSGGFSREILWLVNEINRDLIVRGKSDQAFKVLGVISSENPEDWTEKSAEIPILGNDNWAFQNLDKETEYIIAIGDPKTRFAIAYQYESQDFKAATLIHPSVKKSEQVKIGSGSIICAGSILTTQIRIGKHTIINLNCTVGHDCKTGDFVTLSPGTNISGNVKIGNGVEIGSGSVILPGLVLGDWSVVGAGSVLTRDLAKDLVVAGNPAKEMTA